MRELEKIHRQKDDIEFAELLNRIRLEGLSDDDYEKLQERFVSNLDITDEELDRKLHVFPTNAAKDKHNAKMIKKFKDAVTMKALDMKLVKAKKSGNIRSRDFEVVNDQCDAQELSGLPKSLSVAVGAPIMITKNLCVEAGLVNGARGIVKEVNHCLDSNDSQSHIVVEFQKLFGEKLPNENKIEGEPLCAKIFMQTVLSESSRHNNIYRRQYPMILAFAITIHKSQGLTVSDIVITVDTMKNIQAGLCYVALSRVTSWQGLFIKALNPNAVKVADICHKEMERLRTFSTGDKSAVDSVIPEKSDPKSKQAASAKKAPNSKSLSSLQVDSGNVLIKNLIISRSECTKLKIQPDSRDQIESFFSNNVWLEKEILIRQFCDDNDNATIVESKLDHYESLPQLIFDHSFEHCIDENVQNFLHPAAKPHFTPLRTSGGGNCLYNAVSIALVGDESQNEMLRALTVWTITNDFDDFKDFNVAFMQDLDPNFDMARPENLATITEEIRFQICNSSVLGAYAEDIAILALSRITQRPIFVWSAFTDIDQSMLRPDIENYDELRDFLSAITDELVQTKFSKYQDFLLFTDRAFQDASPLNIFYNRRGTHYSAILPKLQQSQQVEPFKKMIL